ncbi:DUF3023 domain-containing protein [Ehrlichia ruminantium]|nr:DUF3023 domain-containing protein [Ehrlichia ruminantium]
MLFNEKVMLLKNGQKVTQSLHEQVLNELSSLDIIHIKSCYCMGNTDNRGILNIAINKDKTYNLYTPKSTSLFYVTALLTTNQIKNNPGINQLFRNTVSNFILPQDKLVVGIYLLSQDNQLENVNTFLKNNGYFPSGEVNGTDPTKSKTVYNINQCGKIVGCTPLSSPNIFHRNPRGYVNEECFLRHYASLTYAKFTEV